MNFTQLRAVATCALLTFALTACGGGGGGGGGIGGGSGNSPPRFTSPTSFTFSENQQIAFILTVTDADGDNIVIRDDALGDGHLFQVTVGSDGGVVTLNPPDRTLNYEQPEDVNGDNVYEQTITLSDGKATTTAVIRVAITDADDPPQCTYRAQVDWYENETGLVYTFDGFDEDGPGTYSQLQLVRFPNGLWGREDFESAFQLDQTTGELSLNRAFDADQMEPNNNIDFAVQYSQAGVQIGCNLSVTPVNVDTIVTSGVRLKGIVHSTANLGDLDGDGLDELWVETAIVTDGTSPQPEAYIVYGKTLRDAFSETGAGDIDLSMLANNEGVRLFAPFPLPFTGVVGGAQETFIPNPIGDVDGDGLPEVLIGIRPGTSSQTSVATLDRPYAYLVWGSALAANPGSINLLTSSPGQALAFSGAGNISRLNLDVLSGDFDGDGVPDVIISLPDMQSPTSGFTSRMYVIFGDTLARSRALGTIRVDTNSEVALFTQLSPSAGFSGPGARLLSPGDFDGDGKDELLAAGSHLSGSYVSGDDIASAPRNVLVDMTGIALPFSHFIRMPWFSRQSPDMSADGIPDVVFSMDSSLNSGNIALIAEGRTFADYYENAPQLSLALGNEAATRILFAADAMGEADSVGIGDIDGDGIQDIALGIPKFSNFEEGPVVRIVLGSAILGSGSQRIDVEALAPGQSLEIRGVPRGGLGLTTGMSSISDIDGDGRMDIVLTSFGRGEVYIIPSTEIMTAINAGRQVLELEPRFAFEPTR
ncbi:Ig-like domain-containing protein [Hyphomonas sp. NPDC076900]|uniref:Ig-like domain-containing protein n=1 Tax=unclassified Hyphomonas TaxID=2630699 RepID=UPI003CFD2E45